MATHYSRGRAAEWRLRKHLQASRWTVIRAAGSKGPHDLVACPTNDFDSRVVVGVQVKATASLKACQSLLRAFQPMASPHMTTQLWVWHAAKWHTNPLDAKNLMGIDIE